jgi:hypothetical protein
VLRGYIGDRSAPPVLDGPLGQAFNILGQGYQVGRPQRTFHGGLPLRTRARGRRAASGRRSGAAGRSRLPGPPSCVQRLRRRPRRPAPQRPLELATLRLQNMVGVLSKCG